MPSASAFDGVVSSTSTGRVEPPITAVEEVSTARRTPARSAAPSTTSTDPTFTARCRASPGRKWTTPAEWTTASQPARARSTEAASSTSPVTRSTGAPSRLRRSLVARTRARTACPRRASSRATQEPMNPVAPVTRTRTSSLPGRGGGLGPQAGAPPLTAGGPMWRATTARSSSRSKGFVR